MKTYLITGGAGFFGSILKEMLLDLGHEVVSIDLKERESCSFGEARDSSDLGDLGANLVSDSCDLCDSSHANLGAIHARNNMGGALHLSRRYK